MTQNSLSPIQMEELLEIQSKLVSCGNESLKLALELVALTLTLSTLRTEHYQKLKSNLVYALWEATSVTKSISQQVKNVQQCVASPPSTLENMMSGAHQEWSETLLDTWTTYCNSLSTMLQSPSAKPSIPPTESVPSAWEQWASMIGFKTKD